VADKPIEQVLADNTPRWMALSGVVGTALGEHRGRPCILVLTAGPPGELSGQIPDRAEGHPVVLRETGTLRARD
jgi:hypothetical protein